jgi:hypothetical protein
MMPSKLYWQSVQLSSLLRFIAVVVVGGAFAVGGGCDSDRAGLQWTQRPQDPHPLNRSSGDPLAPSKTAASPGGDPLAVGASPADASELEPKADPLAPAGDLQAEMDAFTTVDACVESRTKVDPLLGDVLEAIGYDTFFIDACQLLDAAKSHDAKRCAAIDASPLRERCDATVAEVGGTPDTCPWAIADHPREGRDPACLAIALRDPRLCAGVTEARARATCEAVASHDPKVCTRLGGQAVAQCQRSAARWARAIGPAHAAAAPLSCAETVTYAQTSSGTSGGSTTIDLHSDVQRGLVAVQTHDGWRLHVGGANDDEADLIAPAPHAGANFSFDLLVPAGGGGPVVERAALRVPGHLPLRWDASRGPMQVTLQKLEPNRTGAVQLLLEGDAKDGNGNNGSNGSNGTNGMTSTWHVRADVRAFVRDTVRAVDVGRAGAGDRGGRLGEY